ncbi:MAG TPA: FAD-dependent thymidylate synthase, partial [Anaerolineales bacterium]
TANARVLENVIRKMLSHELAEVREIGEQVKMVARAEIPTLVKYAEAVPYISGTRRSLRNAASPAPVSAAVVTGASSAERAPDWCVLVDYDRDGEDRILAAALFRHAGGTYRAALERIRDSTPGERESLARMLLGQLSEHDIPLRELEYCTYTFELVMDQGAYAEFKRHRMMTQTPQRLTTRLGYSLPRLMVDAGRGSAYDAAMSAASTVFERLAESDADVAQYAVPNGFHRRVLARFNLREAFAFCELRSAPNAHFSIRRIAQQVAHEVRRVHPLLAAFMRLPAETSADVEERHFAAPEATD